MKSQDFLKICINVNDDCKEALANFVFENGALGIIEQDDELHAYFDSIQNETAIRESLDDYIRSLRWLHTSLPDINVRTEKIENRDWNAEWKNSLGPIFVSEQVLIKPTWVPTPEPAPHVVIEIDPEMAFGSGEHATTKLTLQLIEKNIRPNIKMLDIGTGTGILAIGALKMGAALVYAFDIDPVAAQTAQRNAEKNHVAKQCLVFTGTLDAVRLQQFDIITANVNRLQILKMLPQISARLAPAGIFLISGILDSEEAAIRDACRGNKLSVGAVIKEQEWLAFETRKE